MKKMIFTLKKITLIIVIHLLLISNIFSQEFSEWRGPKRTGIYNETNLLKEWPENGPKLLWSIEGIYKGYSSISVANNTIYLTGVNDTVDVLIAVDLIGNIKWQTPFGRARIGSYPESRCTPTVENDRVYVSSGLGDVTCLNALTGKIIWTVKATEKFEGTIGRWGLAESLIIIDNKVVYSPGGKKTTMVALDKMTGETIWISKSMNDNPSYTSPLLIEKNNIKIIVTVTTNYVIGVAPGNGEILWSFDYDSYSKKGGRKNLTNTPLYNNDRIYVTSGYDHKSVMLDLSDNFKSVSLAWVDTVLDVHHGGVVHVDGYIYGANWINNGQGNWCCIEWETGKKQYDVKWKTKGSIIYADGMLYCYEEKTGYIALVEATPDGFNVISSFNINLGTGPHWSHPVIKNGILYIRHMDALMAFNIKIK